MENYNAAIPYRAFHVGEFLKEQLDYSEMSQSELSKLSGIQKPIINDIIKGRRDITAEQSAIFGEALGVDSDYFWKIQQRYEMDLARINKKVTEQTAAIKTWNIIKTLVSEKFLKKAGIINSKDVKEDVCNVFDMFGVDSIDGLIKLKAIPENVAYRKSEKLVTDENALFTWKYYCIKLSKEDHLSYRFDKCFINELIPELNKVFYDNINVLQQTKEILNRHGIKFVVATKYGQIPVDGLSFWEDENPTVAVTLRHDKIDNFAFSVFHELGHIMMHLSAEKGAAINPMDENNRLLEEEANSFARKNLIPVIVWNAFKTEYRKSSIPLERFIKRFADKNGINPRIIYGRFCHEADNYRHKVSFPYKIL